MSDAKLPVHIGFIMDGNGRWAQKRGMPRKMGHREGAQAFRKIAKYCKKIGIKYSANAKSTEVKLLLQITEIVNVKNITKIYAA